METWLCFSVTSHWSFISRLLSEAFFLHGVPSTSRSDAIRARRPPPPPSRTTPKSALMALNPVERSKTPRNRSGALHPTPPLDTGVSLVAAWVIASNHSHLEPDKPSSMGGIPYYRRTSSLWRFPKTCSDYLFSSCSQSLLSTFWLLWVLDHSFSLELILSW